MPNLSILLGHVHSPLSPSLVWRKQKERREDVRVHTQYYRSQDLGDYRSGSFVHLCLAARGILMWALRTKASVDAKTSTLLRQRDTQSGCRDIISEFCRP